MFTLLLYDVLTVVIWDDSQGDPNSNVVMDITFAQPVEAVRLKKDRYLAQMNFVHFCLWTFLSSTRSLFNTLQQKEQMLMMSILNLKIILY